MIPGEVVFGGRRVDALAPPMPAVILRGEADGYGETGFHPARLVFPTEGCWEVTAMVGDSKLMFVTLVVKVSFAPLRPNWLPEGLSHTGTDVVGLPQSIRYLYAFPDGRKGDLIIETTLDLQKDSFPWPTTAQQQFSIGGQSATCVRGDWDEQQQRWDAELDAGILAWTAEGLSYQISYTGLELRCTDLLHIVRSRS
jgi:hypothetical protein